MDVGSCGSGASNMADQNMADQSLMCQEDNLDFEKMMNPNAGYGAQQSGMGSTMSVGAAGGMDDMDGGMTNGLPKMHSGTDHLMQSGLMMSGDAMQDFNLNNANGDYDLSSYISGNKYVVQDVTERVMGDHGELASKAADGDMGAMDELEGKIAKELTNVNDVEDIQNEDLRDAFVQEAKALGLSDKEMDHLLHSPLAETGAGGLVDWDSKISGALHTFDPERTRATNMGNGMYEVHLVSNNGENNAHDNMDISTFYTRAGSADEAKNIVNQATENGGLDKDARYNLTNAGMNIMMNNLSNYV